MMKKRKILAVLLSLVLILSAFGGCTQSKLRAYSAYSSFDKIWTEYESTYTPPSEASVTFNGVTYTGTYSGLTFWTSKYYYEFYSYRGDGVSFNVDAKGRLFFLSLEHQEDKTCTFDEACWRKAADEVADDYISLDNHRVEYVVMEYPQYPHLHEYRYERDLGSGYTGSDIIIRMNCSGEICYFRHNIAFENVKSVVVERDKVQKAVDQCMKETYGDRFSRWEIRFLPLIKTVSNQCGLNCILEAYENYGNGKESESEEIIEIIVIVDHEKFNPFKP